MSQQIQITGGAKVRNLDGVITGSTGVLNSLPINGANGIPQLDFNGKILVSQLPNSVMEYKGMWNVATNTPYLVNGTGNAGDVYLVTGAAAGGTSHDFGAGAITFYNSDQVIYDGTNWDRASGSSGTVTSVGLTMPSAFSVSGSPVTNSGTLAVSALGTTSQYINGAGGLTTFPSLTGYVPYTGATNDVDLGTHKLTLTDEQFNPSSAPSYSEGEVWYDSTQKALAYYNDVTNNTLHIGQEVQLKVYNNTGSTIVKGAPVYITSTNSGFTYPLVALAKADTLTTANVIGVANQDIPTSTAGYIVLSGLVSNISTGSYTVGTVLYLSPYSAGQLMSTVPPTGYAVRVGVVSYSNSPNGSIYINQSNAYSTAASIVGTIQISQGGTGATTAGVALTNLGAAASSRLISTTTPLQGGGDLTADRTLSILQAGTSQSGYLSSTDWNTFNNKQNALGYVPVGGSGSVNYISKFTGSTTISNSGIYEGVTNYVSIGNTNTTYNLDVTGTGRFTGDVLFGNALTLTGSSFLNSMTHIKQVSVMYPSTGYTTIAGSSTGLTLNTGGAYTLDLSFPTTASYTYTYPSASGTLALTSQLSGVIYGSGATYQVAWFNATNSIGGSSNLYFDPTTNRLGINQSSPLYSLDVTGTARITGNAIFGGTLGNGTYTYTLPSATGTLALTSNLSSYVPYSGATGSLYMGSSYLVSAKAFVTSGSGGGAYLKLLNALTAATPESDGVKLSSVGSVDLVISSNTYNSTLVTSGNTADRTYTFPNASGTIALTSNIPTLSGTAPISYSAGVISISQATNVTNGYLTSTDWTTFNNKQAALSGTGLVKSTAGSITYITDNSSSWNSGSAIANSLNGVSPINFNSITGAISISQANTSTNGYLSSTDWNTFNGKQNALTNPVTGTGTTNYISKWTASGTIGNTSIYEGTSGYISIGNTNNLYNLDVTGTGRFTGNLNAANFAAGSATATYPFNSISAAGTQALLNSTRTGGGGIILQNNGTDSVYLGTANWTGISGYGTGTTDIALSAASNSSAILFATGTSSTARMIITSSGNVGIGTPSPSYGLDILGTTAGAALLRVTYSGYAQTFLQAFNGIGYVGTLTNDHFAISTNSTEKVRITSGGNVGIGTTSPTGTYGKLSVAGGISILDDNSAKLEIGRYSSGAPNSYIKIGTNSNSLRITNAADSVDLVTFTNGGNVGIGTTSPTQTLTTNGNIAVGGQQAFWLRDDDGFSSNTGRRAWAITSNYVAFGMLSLYVASAASSNPLSGTAVFNITSGGNVGIGTTSPTSFGASYVTTSVNGGTGGIFETQANGTGALYIGSNSGNSFIWEPRNLFIQFGTNNTERMRITSGGNVLIGTTSESSLISSGLQVTNSASGGPGQLVLHNTGATSTYYWTMGQNSGNAFIVYGYNGSSFSSGVYMTWGATSWTGNSDIRLKNIIKPIDNAVNKLLTLNPIIFSWKSDENNKENLGLIAQDVEKVFPQIVDMQDDKIGTKGVRYTDLIPVLVKAIQEQQAQIEELKSLINK